MKFLTALLISLALATGGAAMGNKASKNEKKQEKTANKVDSWLKKKANQAGKAIKKGVDATEKGVKKGAKGAKKGTKPVSCDMCGGRGAVLQSAGFFQVQSTCPKCRGQGEMIADPCEPCSGRGRVPRTRECEVRLPEGIDDGMRLRLAGEGEPGEAGAPAGDLFCVIRIRQHEFFERQDTHVLLEVPITFTQAALGAEI